MSVQISSRSARDESLPLLSVARASTITPDDAQALLVKIHQMQHDLQGVESILSGCAQSAYVRKPRKIPLWFVSNLLAITFVWQMIAVLVLYFTDWGGKFSSGTNSSVDTGVAVLLFFQFVHIFTIFATSIKMGKQLLHRTLSGWFLVQSYMSAILLFAGIYMAIYRLNPDSFSGMSISNEASLGVIGIYLAFLYYSTELMTTVGLGDVHPMHWSAIFVTFCQMLVSVAFSTIIVSKGMSYLSGYSTYALESHSQDKPGDSD